MKRVKKSFVSLLKAKLLVLTIVLGVVVLPQFHNYLVRLYVGSKIVKLTGSNSGGTGFHIKAPSGKIYIMTNNHICNLADKDGKLSAYLNNSLLPTGVKVFRQSKRHDLCLVTPIKKVSGLRVAKNTYIGEIVALVGHPALRPITISKGEIVGERVIELNLGYNLPKDKCFGETLEIKNMKNPFFKFIFKFSGINTICRVQLRSTMLNAIAYGGNSGSPVIDIYGQVVGVLFAGSGQVTDAYLVPLDEIQLFIKDL